MYFDLPTSQDRMLAKKSSSSSLDSTSMTDERISEIIHNLDDHWGSPPILTPNTLSHILNHQWINEEGDIKKVSKAAAAAAAAAATVAATRVIHHNNKLISSLIEEFCKTLQRIDGKSEHEITSEIKNDPIIQKFISNKEEKYTIGREENVIQHMIDMLSNYNNGSSSSQS